MDTDNLQQSLQQDPDAVNHFDSEIQRLRKLTDSDNLAQLARFLGISRQAINSARDRRKVPLRWYTKISKDFGIPLDYLIYGKQQKDSSIHLDNRSLTIKKDPNQTQWIIGEPRSPYHTTDSSNLSALAEQIRKILEDHGLSLRDTKNLIIFHLLLDLFTRRLEEIGIK